MKKRWNYIINSSVTLIGGIAVILVFNILVSVFVSKFPVKLDLTTAKIYEVSESTYEYLKSYELPTTIYILASEANEDKNVREIIDKYAKANKNINIVNINPSENPTFGKKYADAGYNLTNNAIIVDGGDRFKVYPQAEMYNLNQTKTPTSIRVEQKMTAALKYISSSSDYKIYFVEGHGEERLAGAEQKLKNENYITDAFNISTDEVPQDANMIIIADPKSDFTKAEIAKLDTFFAKSGKAQFIFDGTTTDLPNLYTLIREWGIEVNDDIIIDESNMMNIGLIKGEFEENDITSNSVKNGRMAAYYPFPKSLTKLYDANSGVEVVSVMETSENAYQKTNAKELLSETNIKKNNTDKTGAFVIAAAATKQGANPDEDSIIFVSGSTMLLDADPDVVTNSYGFANYDLYLSAVQYLEGSKENYSVQPRSLAADMLTVQVKDYFVIGGICVVIIPLAILIYGIVVWVRRKHL